MQQMIRHAGLGMLLAIAACSGRTASSSAAAPREEWAPTWYAPQQLTEPRNMPPAPLTGATLRQVIYPRIGGQRVRLRLSNIFGSGPMAITSVHLARSTGQSAIDTASDRALTFGGAAAVTIAAGDSAVSDPVSFDLPGNAPVAITMVISQAPDGVTGHPGSRMTSFLMAGDWVRAASLPEAARTEHWYAITGLDVVASGRRTLVTLGNSITDGRGSITDQNNRWPDLLALRLQADPRTRNVTVINVGIGGNTILRGGLGPTALARLDRDVLNQPGVRWVIIKEGVNDLGGARQPGEATRVAQELIAAYQQIIARAHARSILMYGGTILPFGGNNYGSPEQLAARQTVNDWIRSSGVFDAVIDFDAALRDPARPDWLLPANDTGDHLHPNENGYRVMADFIDLALFTR